MPESSKPRARKLRLKNGRFRNWLLVMTELTAVDKVSSGTFEDSAMALLVAGAFLVLGPDAGAPDCGVPAGDCVPEADAAAGLAVLSCPVGLASASVQRPSDAAPLPGT